jgi:lysine 6-dehydrogenase
VAAVIGARLKPLEGDTDVCVMWNTVSGTKNGRESRIDYYMWDEADTKTGMSSMARVTGFSAAIGALLIGRREIRQKGIVPPEDCIEGALYKRVLSELKARNIIIREVSSDQSSK